LKALLAPQHRQKPLNERFLPVKTGPKPAKDSQQLLIDILQWH